MARNLVFRADGKMVNVARKQGHLFVCADGCCCGHTERAFAPVPRELYHEEWERRRLRNKVHLTIGGCLGPCPLANVNLLLFDGHHIWFHSINHERQVLELFDYVEQMLAANVYLPPPPALADYHFTSFTWDGHAADDSPARPQRPEVERNGILVLTQADTDLLTFAHVQSSLPNDFPPVRVLNPSYLKTDTDVEAFLDRELPLAEVVVLRLIGGRASFQRGLERIITEAERDGFWVVCLPGTEALDPELTALSNVGVPVAHELFAYLQYGGESNYGHALRFLSDHLLTTGFGYEPPAPQPRHGVYHPDLPRPSVQAWNERRDPQRPTVGVLFYRSHYLSGNTDFVDTIVRAGEAVGLNVLPVFAYSLKESDADGAPGPLSYFSEDGHPFVDVVISTMSFAVGGVNPEGPTPSDWTADALTKLSVPILQAVTASSSRDQWEASLRGLSPLDTAMNVAIPEFDGRIITVPISFKENEIASGGDGSAVRYVADEERVARLIAMAARLCTLRHKPNQDKRVAVMLTNQAGRASRIGNAVGLDAPASLLRLFDSMKSQGYRIEGVPESGDALIHALIDRCSYDVEILTESQLASSVARVGEEQYQGWFGDLAAKSRDSMTEQWGVAPGEAYVHEGAISLAGLEFGNVGVFLQPPRGYGMDPNAIYHMPDLPPPHHYHALYRWLRDPAGWGADAIIHLGKHGTLEWLPGKAVGPGPSCYPDQFLADLPLIYPFIINDPGEGAQAKRRTHAVIVDHMTPPMTSAALYGELSEMAQLVDEYYQVELLDPVKAPLLQRQIWDVLQRANLGSDLQTLLNRNTGDHTHEWDATLTEEGAPASMAEMRGKDFAHLLQEIDGYLCELAGAEIRDGLHTLGTVPEGEQLVELLFHLVRLPNLDVPALPDAIATSLGLDLPALRAEPGILLADDDLRHSKSSASSLLAAGVPTTAANLIELVDDRCRALIRTLASYSFDPAAIQAQTAVEFPELQASRDVSRVVDFVCARLVPGLAGNRGEIDQVLRALDGQYVPAGPSGAPTRGMAHVLPTGRNFYAVDPRTLPSVAAQRVGDQLAAELLKRHLDDQGAYPTCVGISIWGTSAMRTHGDDIAEVFALLGVRPRWQPENRRLLGVEPISLADLGRPRIDVVCRISGFFRDAFPHLIALLDEAVQLVAELDEPPDQNFVRARCLAEQERLQAAGLAIEDARRRSRYRVFGCKPGSYGAGILPLIDERNWQGAADFAEAYVNWGGFAYSAEEFGTDARDDFRQQLGAVSVAVKNQDNREHDIFDSDDYFQYHGGMIATIRALSGKAPRRYFGDSSDPRRARVRDLKEESLRVFRTRVVNPKWLESIRRHGYKGGLELAATVDYLFGYDATAGVVDDWMYAKLGETYVLDADQQEFLRRSNPWALHDISGRLLEAAERGLWEHPDAPLLDQLRTVYLESDADIEGR